MTSGVYKRKITSLKERLLRQSIPVPECGCWIFEGSLNHFGYGQINIGDGRCQLTHRVSFELFRGPIPKGMFVLHTCDIPSCINPDHLWIGDQAANMADMARKGRSGMRGTRNPNSKLTYEAAEEIRSSALTRRELAEKFSVSASTIDTVIQGKIWIPA